MSRIHEALQRARQGDDADGTFDSEGATAETHSGDAAILAREPFPRELTPPHPSRDDEPSREQPYPPENPGAEATEKEPRKPLFERLDAQMAEKVVVDSNMSALSREQYRRLAAILHDAQGTSGLKVIMVASAVPGEGKTLTATNVALTLSDSYKRRVLLIDADLRKPKLHEIFRLNTTSGLIDGLEAKDEVKLVLRQVSNNLSVLPAGRPTSDPMAGLTSDRMRRLIEEARATFDWVVIDTPPLMLLPDANLLSTLVDGAVLVVRANSTPHELVRRTADVIGRNRVIGVVLNQVKGKMQQGYGYSGYGGYYGGYYLQDKQQPSKQS